MHMPILVIKESKCKKKTNFPSDRRGSFTRIHHKKNALIQFNRLAHRQTLKMDDESEFIAWDCQFFFALIQSVLGGLSTASINTQHVRKHHKSTPESMQFTKCSWFGSGRTVRTLNMHTSHLWGANCSSSYVILVCLEMWLKGRPVCSSLTTRLRIKKTLRI